MTAPQPHQQQNVQRLLGRCMLRLQQYERLLKGILAHHEVGGPVDELEALLGARVQQFAGKSLGQLAQALFESCVVIEGVDRPVLDERKVPVDKISMSIQFRMEMSAEQWVATKAAISELVSLRNELVHHLIERFDVWTESGCTAACAHLLHSYERIDSHFEELRQWVEQMDAVRALSASFMQSDAFKDLVVNGIAPDGTVDWPAAGIVRVLREAARELQVDGWATLEVAQAWIAKRHPEQTPGKYSCRTWRQVLHESRLFQLQYQIGERGQKVARYRERTSAS